MNHKRYLHNRCIILKILNYIMWHFVHRHDPNLTSPSGRNRKLKFSKIHISWTTGDIFTIFKSSWRSIIILHFIHRHDPIWPLLPVENESFLYVYEQPFHEYTQRAVWGIVYCKPMSCTWQFNPQKTRSTRQLTLDHLSLASKMAACASINCTNGQFHGCTCRRTFHV